MARRWLRRLDLAARWAVILLALAFLFGSLGLLVLAVIVRLMGWT